MSRTRTLAQCFPALSLGLAVLLTTGLAQADPIQGRDRLKFSQLPMDGTPVLGDDGTVAQYWGHDEVSTAYRVDDGTGQVVYQGQFMADDFADRFNSPVVHVKWWGSYLGLQPGVTPADPVKNFLIAFESDIPADPISGFSRPGDVLSSQIVTSGPLSPGSGTFTEKLISGGGPPLNEALYEYNAELHLGQEFPQKPDTVYWLKIVALVEPNDVDPTQTTRWGWHNRDYSLNDPLASVAPAVVPGEYIEGFVGPAVAPTPVWHFQDDAVTGGLTVRLGATPDTGIDVFQDPATFLPTHYLPDIDGPPNVGNYSKDLAFQLFTIVPEPSSIVLGCMGMFFLGVRTLRRRQSKP